MRSFIPGTLNLLKARSLLPFLAGCTALFGVSCHRNAYHPPPGALFQLMSPDRTGIHFENDVTPSDSLNVFNYRSFYNGGGVAIGDVNNDGLADIFLVSNMGRSKLYLNRGNWHFQDVTHEAGLDQHRAWSTGVAMADVNADGRLDIYICNSGNLPGQNRANQLFINLGNDRNGIPHFSDEASQYGLADRGMTTHATFFDYDGDGWLDCFVLNNSPKPIGSFGYDRHLRDIRDSSGGDKLYHNDRGHFTDVSARAGIYGSVIGFGLGVTVADLNGDHWPDLYVSNDFFEKDYLYINNQDGTFREVSDSALGHMSQTSMGSDIADLTNDGLQDIVTTDMLPWTDYRLKTISRFDDFDLANAKLANDFHHQFMSNMLQLNNGDGTFSEVAWLAGVEASDWSWGALAFDMDNDGWKDLYISNGIFKDLTDQDFQDYFADEETRRQVEQNRPFDYRGLTGRLPSVPIPNVAFINQHGLKFRDESAALGMAIPSFSNGAAYGDLDNDGDLDLVVNNENGPCFIFRNMTSEKLHRSFLRVRLRGMGGNTMGIGAEVTAWRSGNRFVLQEMPQRGFESSMDPTLVFGLDTISMLDSLVIVWPGREHRMQLLREVPVNQTITLRQQDARLYWKPRPQRGTTLYREVSANSLVGDSRHRENPFNDFDRQRLTWAMLSTEGPKLAVGDVNGDGLPDFFIGGARGDPGKIFLQTPDGRFRRMEEPSLDADTAYEDIGAVLVDVNHDGKPDLVVASGGDEQDPGSPLLMPRLYLNDGKGHFTRSRDAFPSSVSTNASCIRAVYLNGDKDPDLFLGGRDVPGSYGLNPRSFLLINDGKGHFTDQTEALAPGLSRVGMVTDACWADADGDGKPDLVVVGEWMGITIFRNTGSGLQLWKVVPGSSGWWNCILATDLNGDGKTDFILGNLGLNSPFRADPSHPLRLYLGDFFGTGHTEGVLTVYRRDSIAYPFNMRDDMVDEMPQLKKKFPGYSDYGGKTITQIFSPEQLRHARVKTACFMQSAILLNLGGGNFSLRALPLRAQFSPVYGILCSDLCGDGHRDIFLAGNFYSLKPQVGRYDASYGCLLRGDGKGGFSFVPPAVSGLMVPGETRDLREIQGAHGLRFILAARNNDQPLLFLKNP